MLRSTLFVLLLAFSALASAEDFDYNYLYLGYGNSDFDFINSDGGGFTLGASYAFTDSFHTFAGYDIADLGASGLVPDTDATRFRAGFGYNMGLSETVDLVAKLSYESVDLNPRGPGSFDDSGYGLSVGVRFAATEDLELNGGIKRVDYSDLGDDTGFEIGGLYSFNETWSLGVNGEFSDEISVYSVSGRFYFGN